MLRQKKALFIINLFSDSSNRKSMETEKNETSEFRPLFMPETQYLGLFSKFTLFCKSGTFKSKKAIKSEPQFSFYFWSVGVTIPSPSPIWRAVVIWTEVFELQPLFPIQKLCLWAILATMIELSIGQCFCKSSRIA